jgi:hypothetical protein
VYEDAHQAPQEQLQVAPAQMIQRLKQELPGWQQESAQMILWPLKWRENPPQRIRQFLSARQTRRGGHQARTEQANRHAPRWAGERQTAAIPGRIRQAAAIPEQMHLAAMIGRCQQNQHESPCQQQKNHLTPVEQTQQMQN